MSGTGPEAGETAPRVPADPGPASVLIVDDDRWTTRAIAAALTDDGTLTVLEPRHSGEDAVEAFIRFRPDLVLMDVNMPPGMSGVDATAQIIEADPGARIVLLTTVSPGPGIARALEAGALAAVNKTASDAELVGVVKAALGGDSPALLRSLAADIVLSGDPLPEAPEAAPVLTDKELILLRQLCEGMDYNEIAEAQFVSLHTVKSHARNLRIKLGAKNLAQVVVRAIQFKFYSPE
ncbi:MULTISPECIES: response regulator transcription factor [unclassified Brevibacterium]|uniref:response regulator transcription factor n=1 Tax=unclassified Brevibacterium TaxID=2614124 RepID=UPI0010F8B2A1|nr:MULTISPECIES: response regulator transcription factor [unclassified Brevibacterium]MCM1011397.1 response regulator transcription factor [Brevibacterium sp. XM4083]